MALSDTEKLYYEKYIIELRKAYFSGASRVKYQERDTTFRSKAEMKALIDELEELVSPAANKVSSGASFAEFGTGL